jgi:hypothetical protein
MDPSVLRRKAMSCLTRKEQLRAVVRPGTPTALIKIHDHRRGLSDGKLVRSS